MLIELGNHSPHPSLTLFDDRPKITTIHIPEADDEGLGGYTHEPGAINVSDFKAHLADAHAYSPEHPRYGITRLPGHEALLSILHPSKGAWGHHGAAPPAWVKATAHDLTPKGRADDIEEFLSKFYGAPRAHEYFGTSDEQEQLVKKELTHWTSTEPGVLPSGLVLPNTTALYTNNGRVISNVNDGGGQVGAIGVGITTGTDATHLGVSVNPGAQYVGYRIVVYSTTSNNFVWGNILALSSSLVTVDRWYNFATPGGAAGTTPTTPWAFAILDGGFVSTWFVGLATGANAPAAADTTLATNGNAEITTGGGGLIRKIAPYAQTSGVATRSFTLTPVYTANGSDSLPATVTTIGVFCSMVAGTAGSMKFETALTSATLSAIGDQLTVTETVNGS